MFKSVAITIPDFLAIPDENLAEIARDFDGRWSEQTKSLLQKFRSNRLDLNSGWANTPTGWTCPCCRRTKPEIARLTSNKVLRCKLEEHHDHLIDHVRRIFDETNPSVPKDGNHNYQRNIAKDAIVELTARFESVLICSDCNAAEGRAKGLISDMDRHFTFSPNEIATFIKRAPNLPHEIDGDVVGSTWEGTQPDFLDRIDFAKRMSIRFFNGKNRRQPVLAARFRPFKDSSYFWVQITEAAPELREPALADQLLKRSVSRDGEGQFVAGKKAQKYPPPTDEEFVRIEKLVPAGKEMWKALGEEWTCTCCGRNKRQICRKSKRNEWTARIHKVDDWVLETSPASLGWRRWTATSPIIIGAHVARYICQDCKIVTGKMRRRSPEASDFSLTWEDIKSVLLDVEPNRDHNVDYDEAARCAHANRELVDAITDYSQ